MLNMLRNIRLFYNIESWHCTSGLDCSPTGTSGYSHRFSSDFFVTDKSCITRGLLGSSALSRAQPSLLGTFFSGDTLPENNLGSATLCNASAKKKKNHSFAPFSADGFNSSNTPTINYTLPVLSSMRLG